MRGQEVVDCITVKTLFILVVRAAKHVCARVPLQRAHPRRVLMRSHGQLVVVIAAIHHCAQSDLFEIGKASRRPRLFFGLAQRRQEQRREDCDYRNHHEQLNQCKGSVTGTHDGRLNQQRLESNGNVHTQHTAWVNRSNSAGAENNRRSNQAIRGGGNGGLEEMESAEKNSSATNSKSVGARTTKDSATSGNSSFNFSVSASDFCSDCFPALMALHNGQGCSPSNVCETASVRDCWLERLAASIVLHATVCSAAQCRPVARTSARTTRNFPQRTNTKAD